MEKLSLQLSIVQLITKSPCSIVVTHSLTAAIYLTDLNVKVVLPFVAELPLPPYDHTECTPKN